MEHPRVPVLWFDKEGNGPGEMYVERHDFPAEKGGAIPARLGLRIRARDGAIVATGSKMIDGGFMLGREQAQELHRLLGGWLEKTAPVEPSDPDVFL